MTPAKLRELVRLAEARRVRDLSQLDRLRTHYQKLLKSGKNPGLNEVCLALVEQHGEMTPHAESILAFQEILRQHGPSAAAYYGIGYSMEAQGNRERAVFN